MVCVSDSAVCRTYECRTQFRKRFDQGFFRSIRDSEMTLANHALQRLTAGSRSCCKQRAFHPSRSCYGGQAWPPSLSLGRWCHRVSNCRIIIFASIASSIWLLSGCVLPSHYSEASNIYPRRDQNGKTNEIIIEVR